MSSNLLEGFVKLGEPTRNFELRSLLNSWRSLCPDSVSHNRVHVLSIPVLLLTCSQDWTFNLQMIASLEAWGTNAYYIYPTPPLGQDMTQGQFLSGV